jgi:hypothetical protein
VAVVLSFALRMTTKINLGFRHALPALPFACVLIGAGVAAAWRRSGKALRSAIAVLVVWNAGSALAKLSVLHPYVSSTSAAAHLRGPGRLEPDWGQSSWRCADSRDHDVSQVYLGYLRVRASEAYGIDYVAASFFGLRGGGRQSFRPPRTSPSRAPSRRPVREWRSVRAIPLIERWPCWPGILVYGWRADGP